MYQLQNQLSITKDDSCNVIRQGRRRKRRKEEEEEEEVKS
jgi:hypothetical protein